MKTLIALNGNLISPLEIEDSTTSDESDGTIEETALDEKINSGSVFNKSVINDINSKSVMSSSFKGVNEINIDTSALEKNEDDSEKLLAKAKARLDNRVKLGHTTIKDVAESKQTHMTADPNSVDEIFEDLKEIDDLAAEFDDDFEDDIYSTFWYSGSICYNPKRNIIAQCMNTIDYIHIIDLDNDKYFSIHQSGSPTFNEITIPKVIENDVYKYDYLHFNKCIGTEHFFLVIYLNGDYRKNNLAQTRGEAAELLAFDWDGYYLGGVKLDIMVQDLAFDPIRNILYGLRIRDEKIVSFDLSEFITVISK